MTVDLGFAWFDLPRGSVGVVDVPGHHRLVKNMLAGVGLVDFVLLVIADDGWMPQTQGACGYSPPLRNRQRVVAHQSGPSGS